MTLDKMAIEWLYLSNEYPQRGEDIVITRHGRPVAELKAIPPRAKPVTPADLDWLAARRLGRRLPDEDAGTFISKMRDEDER